MAYGISFTVTKKNKALMTLAHAQTIIHYTLHIPYTLRS